VIPSQHIAGHHALRGIAAVAVAVMHLQLASRLGAEWLQVHLTFLANQAVDLFFILSGFIFAYIYSERSQINWREFYVARFARIYPLYLLSMGLVIGLDVVTYLRYGAVYRSLSPLRLLTNVLGIQAWFGHGTSESINLPSWSVSVEIFLYILAFPMLVRLFGTSFRPRLTSLSAVLLTSACVTAWCYVSYPEIDLHLPPRPLLRGVAGFVSGFVLCGWLRNRSWASPFSGAAFCVGCLLVVLTAHPYFSSGSFLCNIVLFLAMNLIVYASFSNHLLPGKLLSGNLFQFLGAISYSLYLWHIPVELSVRRVMKLLTENPFIEETPMFAWFLLFSVMTVSSVSYYCVEDPLRRKIRRCLVGRNSVIRDLTGSMVTGVK